MVFPYRTPAPAEPGLPIHSCVDPFGGPPQCSRCSTASPYPRLAGESAEGAGSGLRKLDLGVFGKVVSLAAVALLTVSTASVAQVAWHVNHARSSPFGAGGKAPSSKPVSCPAPPQQQQAFSPPSLASSPVSTPAKEESRERVSERRPPPPNEPVQHSLSRPVPESAEPVFSLASLGGSTHAPDELWQRARKLGTAGLDVVLSDVKVASGRIAELGQKLQPLAKITPMASARGIALRDLPPDSPGRAIGLVNEDVVTAVNGYALTSPERVLAAYASLRGRTAAVLEVQRAGRPVVIRVGWDRPMGGPGPVPR